mgnify:CR=1 FL=1|tara:strand:+ start:1848 stop:2390 length:543 start_codon:yes stop_codon:yes gene_type:complete
MSKPSEVCVLSDPWKVTKHEDGGILMSLSFGWSAVENCYHLVGKVYSNNGEQHDEQVTTQIPAGNKILVPGEFFIDCAGPFRFWCEHLISKGILSTAGKTFRFKHVEYTACKFHKDKCAPRFKCDQCGFLASSSQAYYDEGIGGTRCLKCEAILTGNVSVGENFVAEVEQAIAKLDKLDI